MNKKDGSLLLVTNLVIDLFPLKGFFSDCLIFPYNSFDPFPSIMQIILLAIGCLSALNFVHHIDQSLLNSLYLFMLFVKLIVFVLPICSLVLVGVMDEPLSRSWFLVLDKLSLKLLFLTFHWIELSIKYG